MKMFQIFAKNPEKTQKKADKKANEFINKNYSFGEGMVAVKHLKRYAKKLGAETAYEFNATIAKKGIFSKKKDNTQRQKTIEQFATKFLEKTEDSNEIELMKYLPLPKDAKQRIRNKIQEAENRLKQSEYDKNMMRIYTKSEDEGKRLETKKDLQDFVEKINTSYTDKEDLKEKHKLFNSTPAYGQLSAS